MPNLPVNLGPCPAFRGRSVHFGVISGHFGPFLGVSCRIIGGSAVCVHFRAPNIVRMRSTHTPIIGHKVQHRSFRGHLGVIWGVILCPLPGTKHRENAFHSYANHWENVHFGVILGHFGPFPGRACALAEEPACALAGELACALAGGSPRARSVEGLAFGPPNPPQNPAF